MVALIDYKGVNVLDPTPVGLGGSDLDDSIREFADRSGPIRNDTANPTVDDDLSGTNGNGKFYQFSKWYNTTTGIVFICLDASTGAAVWETFAGTGATSLVVNEISSTHIVLVTEDVIAASGTFTVTMLPTASAVRKVNLKCVSGTITIDGDGTETIDGSLTKIITTDQSITLAPVAVGWIIL